MDVGPIVVGAMVVGAMVVGALVVGATVVGATVAYVGSGYVTISRSSAPPLHVRQSAADSPQTYSRIDVEPAAIRRTAACSRIRLAASCPYKINTAYNIILIIYCI